MVACFPSATSGTGSVARLLRSNPLVVHRSGCALSPPGSDSRRGRGEEGLGTTHNSSSPAAAPKLGWRHRGRTAARQLWAGGVALRRCTGPPSSLFLAAVGSAPELRLRLSPAVPLLLRGPVASAPTALLLTRSLATSTGPLRRHQQQPASAASNDTLDTDEGEALTSDDEVDLDEDEDDEEEDAEENEDDHADVEDVYEDLVEEDDDDDEEDLDDDDDEEEDLDDDEAEWDDEEAAEDEEDDWEDDEDDEEEWEDDDEDDDEEGNEEEWEDEEEEKEDHTENYRREVPPARKGGAGGGTRP